MIRGSTSIGLDQLHDGLKMARPCELLLTQTLLRDAVLHPLPVGLIVNVFVVAHSRFALTPSRLSTAHDIESKGYLSEMIVVRSWKANSVFVVDSCRTSIVGGCASDIS